MCVSRSVCLPHGPLLPPAEENMELWAELSQLNGVRTNNACFYQLFSH